MRHLLFPILPVTALIVEALAPQSILSVIIWCIIAFIFSSIFLYLVAYLTVNFIKNLP